MRARACLHGFHLLSRCHFVQSTKMLCDSIRFKLNIYERTHTQWHKHTQVTMRRVCQDQATSARLKRWINGRKCCSIFSQKLMVILPSIHENQDIRYKWNGQIFREVYGRRLTHVSRFIDRIHKIYWNVRIFVHAFMGMLVDRGSGERPLMQDAKGLGTGPHTFARIWSSHNINENEHQRTRRKRKKKNGENSVHRSALNWYFTDRKQKHRTDYVAIDERKYSVSVSAIAKNWIV